MPEDWTQQPPSNDLPDARLRGRVVLARWFVGAGVVWLTLLVCLGFGIAALSRERGSTIVSNTSSRISVTGDGANETFTTSAADVVITGDNNSITLHGDCRTVTVSGDGNVVSADQIGCVSLTGDGNKVSWKSGSAPTLVKTGDGNSLTQTSD